MLDVLPRVSFDTSLAPRFFFTRCSPSVVSPNGGLSFDPQRGDPRPPRHHRSGLASCLSRSLQEFETDADAEAPRCPLAFASNERHREVDLYSNRVQSFRQRGSPYQHSDLPVHDTKARRHVRIAEHLRRVIR